MIRVVVADDHDIVRQGLCRVLALAPDMQLAGEAQDGWEVLERLGGERFDLLLLDMTMPGPSGIELIKRVRKEAPRLPVLVLSMHAECQFAAGAIKAGANGYITKDSKPAAILGAIREVAAGRNFMAPELATRLLFEPSAAEGGGAWDTLSAREFEIFLLFAEGRKANDIAADLRLSPKTVSTHKYRIMQKLGVNSVSELIHYAYRNRLVGQAPRPPA
jgi:DNA-binding NarL/FixJ family response regulator